MTDHMTSGESSKLWCLIKRIQDGDEPARPELMEYSHAHFYQIASRLLNRPAFRELRDKGVETGDVLNKTLVERIFKKNKLGKDLLERKEFKDADHFVSTVINRMLYCLKDIVRLGPYAIRNEKRATNAPLNEKGRQPVDDFKAKTSGRSKSEEWAVILESLEDLDETERDVFQYRYIHGLSRVEVAELLGVVPKTVTRHANRAKAKLKKILDERFPGRVK